MALFKKKSTETPKTHPRIAKLSTHEILSLMDTNIMQLGASFDAYRFKDSPEHFVSEYIDNVNMLWLELCSRNHKEHK